MNTKIQYIYENDTGIKLFSGEIVLYGELTESERAEAWVSLKGESGRTFFIPDKLGLESLSPIKDSNFDALVSALDDAESEDIRNSIDRNDHPWHELLFIESTHLPHSCQVTAKGFLESLLKNNFRDLAPEFGRSQN